MIIFRPAERDLPKYINDEKEEDKKEESEDIKDKAISAEFSDKTNQLLNYIEKTYLQGMDTDQQGRSIIEKMKLAENSQKVND